jgi:hypothetical protein
MCRYRAAETRLLVAALPAPRVKRARCRRRTPASGAGPDTCFSERAGRVEELTKTRLAGLGVLADDPKHGGDRYAGSATGSRDRLQPALPRCGAHRCEDRGTIGSTLSVSGASDRPSGRHAHARSGRRALVRALAHETLALPWQRRRLRHARPDARSSSVAIAGGRGPRTFAWLRKQ